MTLRVLRTTMSLVDTKSFMSKGPGSLVYSLETKRCLPDQFHQADRQDPCLRLLCWMPSFLSRREDDGSYVAVFKALDEAYEPARAHWFFNWFSPVPCKVHTCLSLSSIMELEFPCLRPYFSILSHCQGPLQEQSTSRSLAVTSRSRII